MSRPDKGHVLGYDRVNGSTPFGDVPVEAADKTNVIGGVHVQFEVYEISDLLFEEDQNSFEDNEPAGFRPDGFFRSPVMNEVVLRHVDGFSRLQVQKLCIEQV